MIAKIVAERSPDSSVVVALTADTRGLLSAAGPGKRATPLPRVVAQGATLGGADRDRTDDPLLAKQVLSQLSYSP